jgi:hypothetical protein
LISNFHLTKLDYLCFFEEKKITRRTWVFWTVAISPCWKWFNYLSKSYLHFHFHFNAKLKEFANISRNLISHSHTHTLNSFFIIVPEWCFAHVYFLTHSLMLIHSQKWHHGAAKSAQKWADKCYLLTHDSPKGRWIHNYGACGQNIFVSTHKVPW